MRVWLALFSFLLQESSEALRISAKEFDARRAALAERFPEGAALILDAGSLGEVGSDANTPIFDFKYLSGVHDDEGVLVIRKGGAVLFLSDPKKAPPAFENALPLDQFEAWVTQNLSKEKSVYVKLRRKNREILDRSLTGTEVVGGKLGSEITRMRLVKSEMEIRLMKKAADATNKAHLAAMRALRPGMNEKEIQRIIESTFKKEGCPELGFPSIIGAGKNGTTLHYMANDKEIPKDSLIVCDIGASIDNYVTDITRTLPTSGKYSPEQRIHYQCVLDAQKAAEEVLRPGATFYDLESAARKVFKDRDLTKWSYAHSKDRAVVHGLGHYVGMAVHDSGTYQEKFQPGMVITIEPGWYDRDRGYGIRIEDTYLVTKDGFERLSAGAPREMDEIESVMKKKDF
jgi:Xaa-Pro aminopeptidase